MCAKGITEDDVVAYVGGICFKTGPPGLVGVESEWLVTDSQDPSPATYPSPVCRPQSPPPTLSPRTVWSATNPAGSSN